MKPGSSDSTASGATGVWCGVVLAAGSSSRMGVPKSRLEWRGRPLLLHQIAALRAAGAAEVIAVVSPEDAELLDAPPAGSRAVPNPHPDRGKTESLRLGISALSQGEAILICAVDQPRDPGLLRDLVGAHFRAGADITVPILPSGRRGHPVVVSSRLRGEVLSAKEETRGLRGILETDPSRVVEWRTEDTSILLDLNTPGAYEDARRSHRG